MVQGRSEFGVENCQRRSTRRIFRNISIFLFKAFRKTEIAQYRNRDGTTNEEMKLSFSTALKCDTVAFTHKFNRRFEYCGVGVQGNLARGDFHAHVDAVNRVKQLVKFLL